MDRIIVGIDVSKDRLDVEVRPTGEAFSVSRNAAGVDKLVARMRELSPHIIALEATGGFENVVVAALGAAGLPVADGDTSVRSEACAALGRIRDRCRTSKPGCWPILSGEGARSLQ